MKIHPLAEIFPMMSDDEISDLAADIKANGLIHPIVILGELLVNADGTAKVSAVA